MKTLGLKAAVQPTKNNKPTKASEGAGNAGASGAGGASRVEIVFPAARFLFVCFVWSVGRTTFSKLCAVFHVMLAAHLTVTVCGQVPPKVPSAFGGIHPRLSPGGDAIALSYQGAICRVSRDGGVLTRLTRSEGWDLDPAWSPDGRQIAYVNSQNLFLGQLRLMQANDGAPLALPAEVRALGKVEFHRDGQRLLGMFSFSGQSDRLGWYDLKTGKLTPLEVQFPHAVPRGRVPWALANDGERIVVVTLQDQPGEQSGNNGPASDLWIVGSDGGAARHLARWPSRIYNVTWTPDGLGIFVSTDRGGAFNDLWYLPLEEPMANARQLTFGQADEDWPSLSADGRWLAHTENSRGATKILLRDLRLDREHELRIDRIAFEEPHGHLQIRMVDAKTKRPLVARLSVRKLGGKFHAPAGALYRLTAGQGHFYAREEAALELPPGNYEISAHHGPEYRLLRHRAVLKPDERQELELALERWTDMPSTGWYSGENHIHANYGYGAWHNTPASVLDMCEGEDLHVGNIMVANSDGDGVFDRHLFMGRNDPRSRPHTILYWNEEFRSTLWGHMTLINLERLVEPIFTGFKDTTNPWDVPTNADIAQRAHEQSASVSYTHPASNSESPYDTAYAAKGLPVDAALGRIDTLDVMGFGYEASTRLWYRLLNCGFRIPAAAGTDCFLNRIPSYPPGWGRCYVKLERGLTYSEWVQGQKAGRSFVTTGPMLALSVDGMEVGSTVRAAGPRAVRVQGRAWFDHALEKIEIIYNGRIAAAGSLSADKLEGAFDQELTLDQSGWVALRASSSRRTSVGVAAVAHTSPIYVQISGRPGDAKTDAEFFLAWIDRLEADLKRRDRIPVGFEQVAAQIAAARKVYRDLATRAATDLPKR